MISSRSALLVVYNTNLNWLHIIFDSDRHVIHRSKSTLCLNLVIFIYRRSTYDDVFVMSFLFKFCSYTAIQRLSIIVSSYLIIAINSLYSFENRVSDESLNTLVVLFQRSNVFHYHVRLPGFIRTLPRSIYRLSNNKSPWMAISRGKSKCIK